MNKFKTGQIIGSISLIILLIFGLLVFMFALVSGSETFGGGLYGIIRNSPNAIPWAALLILVWVAYRWKLIGGILITLLGFGLLYLFRIFTAEFATITFIIALFPVVLGSMLILSWGLTHHNNNRNS